MKVLFVCSGNSEYKISPIVQNQANSLIKAGVEVDFFPIKGKGIVGYLSNVKKLREFIKGRNYDIIHAHYYLCGIVASLSEAKPLIVSLMGSDIFSHRVSRYLIKYFSNRSWNVIIVKSLEMHNSLSPLKSKIIPNGVDIDIFQPIPIGKAIIKTGFTTGHNIIFVSDPARKEKNYQLAVDSINLINSPDIYFHTVYNLPNDDLVWYYNSADLLLLTSHREGSPNVIKEAMACNCPIISTDVGDVKENISGVENCYLCSNDPGDLAIKIEMVLKSRNRSNGRKKLIEMKLDSSSIADKIINLYKEVLAN